MPVTKPFPAPGENPWGAKIVEWAADVEQVADAAEASVATPEGRLALFQSDEGTTTFVRFVDENGDPLPPGSVTTIHVNTVTGDIDDITFEGAV